MITFSSLRFLFNSLLSPRYILRVARRCFSWFSIFSFSRFILSHSFLHSSVPEALFALSFSFPSERFFFIMLKLLYRIVEINNTGVTGQFLPPKYDFEHVHGGPRNSAYAVNLTYDRHTLIGRAKRAPHWGVQSRFRVIYVIGMSYVVCLSYVKLTA